MTAFGGKADIILEKANIKKCPLTQSGLAAHTDECPPPDQSTECVWLRVASDVMIFEPCTRHGRLLRLAREVAPL